jgi:hypothetical protein
VTGVQAVIHLAGHAGEAAWDRIAEVNIRGTYVVFEAARRAGVRRVVFASSNHAVGFMPAASFPVADYAFPAPDTYYGVSKVTGEALAALYHSRYGLDTVCVRILTCRERPQTIRQLSTWLSPEDTGRLFEACLVADRPGFRVIYGVSRHARRTRRHRPAAGRPGQDPHRSRPPRPQADDRAHWHKGPAAGQGQADDSARHRQDPSEPGPRSGHTEPAPRPPGPSRIGAHWP